jgi:HSP20 family protein
MCSLEESVSVLARNGRQRPVQIYLKSDDFRIEQASAEELPMPIFRWGQSWDPFRDLEREVDRMLQGMNISLHGVRFGRRFPQINLLETATCYVLTAEIPGLDPKQLEVTTASGYLTIKGNRLPPQEAREDSFRRQERFHGPWQRTIQLPERVDEDGMKADYTAGVLRVTLPKAPSAVPRQIKVNEG